MGSLKDAGGKRDISTVSGDLWFPLVLPKNWTRTHTRKARLKVLLLAFNISSIAKQESMCGPCCVERFPTPSPS